MINKVILSGRITKDLEVKQTPSGTAVCAFSIAVERSFAKQGEEKQTDFINVVAWGKTAEFVGKYFDKGRSIAVIGRIQTRTYDDKNGTKHYVTEVVAEEVQFTFEPKQQAAQQQNGQSYAQKNGYPHDSMYAQPAQAPANDYPDFIQGDDDGVPF